MLVLGDTTPIDALRSNRAALRKIAEIEASEEMACTTEVKFWSGSSRNGQASPPRHEGTKTRKK